MNLLSNECNTLKDELISTQRKIKEYQSVGDGSNTGGGGPSTAVTNSVKSEQQQNRVTYRKSSISPPPTKVEYIEDEYKSNLKARRSTIAGASLGPPKRPAPAPSPTVNKQSASANVINRRPTFSPFSPASTLTTSSKAVSYPMSVTTPTQQSNAGLYGMFTGAFKTSSPRVESIGMYSNNTGTILPTDTQSTQAAPTPRYALHTSSSVSKVFPSAKKEEDTEFAHSLSMAHEAAANVLLDAPPKREEPPKLEDPIQVHTFGIVDTSLFTGFLSPFTSSGDNRGTDTLAPAETAPGTPSIFNFGLFVPESEPVSSNNETQAGFLDFFGTSSKTTQSRADSTATASSASDNNLFNFGFLANVLPLMDEKQNDTNEAIHTAANTIPQNTPSKLQQRRSSNYLGAKSNAVYDTTRMSTTAASTDGSKYQSETYSSESSRTPVTNQSTRSMGAAPTASSRQHKLLEAYQRNSLKSDQSVLVTESVVTRDDSNMKTSVIIDSTSNRRTSVLNDQSGLDTGPEVTRDDSNVKLSAAPNSTASAINSNLSSIATDSPAEAAIDALLDAPIDFVIDAADYFLGKSTPKLPRKSLNTSRKTSILIPEDPQQRAIYDDSVLYN